MDVALHGYAMEARAAFNCGPQKTATMACFDAPPARRHVDWYKLLGIETDSDFSFTERLKIIRAIGYSAFEEFHHCAESSGLELAVQAVEVPSRVQPVVTYGIELLVATPGTEAKLNALQAAWARTI